MNNSQFNINVLVEAALDYLYAANERKIFLIGWKKGDWWEDLPADKRENYRMHDERVNCKSDKVYSMCELVGVDFNKLLAMAKAMNRYEKRENWQVCAHISEKSTIKF